MSSHGPQIPAMARNLDGSMMRMPYCPGRDFINIYPAMLRCIVQHFNQNRWPELVGMVAELNKQTIDGAEAELVKANDCFFRFIGICCENSEEKYDDVMRRAGWEELSPAARFGYLALLGCVVAGQLFAGLRDVSLEGESPPPIARPLLRWYYDEARRSENAIPRHEDLITEFKYAVQNCRTGGISYETLSKIVFEYEAGNMRPVDDRIVDGAKPSA